MFKERSIMEKIEEAEKQVNEEEKSEKKNEEIFKKYGGESPRGTLRKIEEVEKVTEEREKEAEKLIQRLLSEYRLSRTGSGAIAETRLNLLTKKEELIPTIDQAIKDAQWILERLEESREAIAKEEKKEALEEEKKKE